MFRCCLCGEEYLLEAAISLFNSFDVPNVCERTGCKSNSFQEVQGSEEWVDYREIKIYDAFTCSFRGRLPESLWVILTAEQVGLCTPGDDVCITGVLLKRWMPLVKDRTCEVQLALYATDLQVYNSKLQRPCLEIVEIEKSVDFSFRALIIRSFAPFIYGVDFIKLGILLCVLGGTREEIGNLHIRGHSHCLLLGEPGTGKSDLLREACKLISRGIYTNAIGASKAGLTLSAVKEGNDWMLEAGALVLSDSGICALDDLSFLNKEDLSEIYECMENQTISVAKAGMVCTVNTRTSIIAACRPKKNRFDFGQELSENASMPAPLLSRFDLIFLVIDLPDSDSDRLKSNFILSRRSEDSGYTMGQLQYLIGKSSKIKPKFSREAEEIINKYFELLRKDLRKDVTMRQLESLLRLAQAHAKLCQREEVTIFDCVSVLMVYESSYRGIGMTKHISFTDQTEFQKGFDEISLALGVECFLIDDSVFK
jgi:DNA helicase MCM9